MLMEANMDIFLDNLLSIIEPDLALDLTQNLRMDLLLF